MASPIVTNTSAQLNGAQLVYGFSTTLTDAQIKALPTTPITVVAAPGSGFRIKILGATVKLNIAVAYTNINTTFFALFLDNPHGTWLWGPALVNDNTLATPLTTGTHFLTTLNQAVIDLPGPGNIASIDAGAASGVAEWVIMPTLTMPDAVDINNTVIRVAMDNNGSGVLTGGDPANGMLVSVYYAIEAMI